jgi:hypothetical protein
VTASAVAPSPASASADVRASASTRWWIWGFLAAFAIHDGEEAWYAVQRGGYYAFGRWETAAQTLAGIVFEFTLLWIVVVIAARAARPGWAVRIFAIVLGGWFLHGFFHLASGVASGGYAFGVVTALPCCLAYGAFAYARLYADRLLGPGWIAVTLVAGGIVALPLIVAAHLFGRLVA